MVTKTLTSRRRRRSGPANIVRKTKEKLQAYEARQEEIQRAALRLFNRHGYRGTTTLQIAREAGVTERTMFRHFENKQVLFIECVFRIVTELTRQWEQNPEERLQNPWAFLEQVIRSYVEFVQKHPDRSMFLVHLYSHRYQNMEGFDGAFRQFVEYQIDLVEEAVSALQALGEVQSVENPRVLAGMFVGQYFMCVFLQEFVGPEGLDVELAIDLMRRTLQAK